MPRDPCCQSAINDLLAPDPNPKLSFQFQKQGN